MALSLSAIKEIAARKGNKLLHAQVNQKSPIVRALKRERCDGGLAVINVQGGGLDSVGVPADGGALPTASSAGITQILVKPVPFFANIAVGQLAASVVRGEMDAVNIVKNQFEVAGANLARTLGTAIFGLRVSGIDSDATIAGGSVGVYVDDAARYRIGASYTWNDNGTRNSNPLTVTAISATSDGKALVTFSTSATGTLSSTDDTIEVRGLSAHDWVGLNEAAGSSDIYGTSVSSADWSGNTVSASGVLTNPLVREIHTAVLERSGEMPDLYAMSPRQAQEYEEIQLGDRRFLDSRLDPFGDNAKAPKVGGKELVVDATCYNLKAFCLVKDAVRLGQFQDFEQYNEFGNDHENYQKLVQMHGQFNLLVHRRNCVGMLDLLTIE